MSLSTTLIVAFLLFGIGTFGLLLRRNVLVMYMCLELILSAVSLILVAFSSYNNVLDGVLLVFFLISIAAAEVAIGLAILVRLFRLKHSVHTESLNQLKF